MSRSVSQVGPKDTARATSLRESAGQLVLSVQGRGLKLDSVEDVKEFAESIRAAENLEEVHFSGNTLGIEAARTLADALAGKEKLKVANFSDSFTGRLRSETPIAVKAICDALEGKPQLEELNLSDNAFGPAGAEALVSFLTNTASLRVLLLNNNGLGVAGGTIIANALLAAQEIHARVGRKSNLQVFIAGRNRLENGAAPLLAKAFEAHGTLLEIGMPQNGIRPEGILAIARSLSKCRDLETLDLQDNTFAAKGAVALAAALPYWNRLRKLNLADCLLKSKGGHALASALASRDFENLEHLLLSFNEIDSNAARAFALTFPRMPNLKNIDLSGNAFDPEGEAAEELKSVLERLDKLDALTELEDMEEEEEEEEEEEDEDEESEEEGEENDAEEKAQAMEKHATAKKIEAKVDELADALKRTYVA